MMTPDSIYGWTDSNVPVRRYSLLVLVLLLLPLRCPAADKPKPANKVDKPDMELLEYLGEWETAGGKWIDPMNIRPKDAQAKTGNTEDHHDK